MTVMELTEANFDDVIANHDLVVIEFGAKWCGPCKAFAPIYEQMAQQHQDVLFTTVDVDEQEDLASDFQVRSVPQIIILREKVAVFSESGTMSAGTLNELLAQAKKLDMAAVHQQIKQHEQNAD